MPIDTLMKLSKVILVTFTLILGLQASAFGQELDQYESRLNSLIENGVIDEKEAQKQLVNIKSQSQRKFHNQVRGIASKIKEVKVYQIVNEPLEIPSN